MLKYVISERVFHFGLDTLHIDFFDLFRKFCVCFQLMPDLLSQQTPPSASPDCKLAHNCVNNRVVSGRYRRAFCVMHGLRP